MTQVETVLRHMQEMKTLTGQEANTVYKIRSLTSIMSRVKRLVKSMNNGYEIASEWKRDLTGQRYVRYHYRKKS